METFNSFDSSRTEFSLETQQRLRYCAIESSQRIAFLDNTERKYNENFHFALKILDEMYTQLSDQVSFSQSVVESVQEEKTRLSVQVEKYNKVHSGFYLFFANLFSRLIYGTNASTEDYWTSIQSKMDSILSRAFVENLEDSREDIFSSTDSDKDEALIPLPLALSSPVPELPKKGATFLSEIKNVKLKKVPEMPKGQVEEEEFDPIQGKKPRGSGLGNDPELVNRIKNRKSSSLETIESKVKKSPSTESMDPDLAAKLAKRQKKNSKE